MAPGELRRRLHAVDPDLTIIPGGHRDHRKKANKNWIKAAGIMCGQCGREAFRSREGLCYPCWEAKEDSEIEVRDKTGILNWMPMSIIEQITHKNKKSQ